MSDNESSEGRNIGSGLIGQLPAILWQRRWLVIAPAMLGIAGSVAAAFLLPETYSSSALMIVQSSQLPTEVTGEGQSEVVDRRIARIRQQITSRPDLVSLIEKHGLYRDQRASSALSEIVEDMRSAIELKPTTADLPGKMAEQRTVAVRLSFVYEDAPKTQAVAQDLMQKLLELDAAGNAQQANNTVAFLSEQAKSLETQIAEVEGKIGQINAANGGVLSQNGIAMIGNNSGSYDVQIASLQRDNAALIAQREVARSSDTRDPVVAAAENQLAAARAMYSENHPDIQIAKRRLEEARELAKSNTQKLPMQTIDSQIGFNNQQIAALRNSKAQEQAQVNSGLAAQARAPAVQQQIAELQQRLTGLNKQNQSVSDRLLAARAGARAEDEQMAERLTVVEPPELPDEPSAPNRPKIMVLGALLGLGAGLALALLLEMIWSPVRSPNALQNALGAAPLGVIPYIEARNTKRSRGERIWHWVMTRLRVKKASRAK